MARPFITVLALATLSVAPLSACSKPPSPRQTCMDGRTRALTEGGFTGPILCDAADASFALAGRISDYAIYDYRYRHRPEHGAVDHGGQRIVVFRGETYLGQYIAAPPPHLSVSVRGAVVHFDAADSQPLDFANGPPAATVLSGHDIRFTR